MASGRAKSRCAFLVARGACSQLTLDPRHASRSLRSTGAPVLVEAAFGFGFGFGMGKAGDGIVWTPVVS